MRTKARIRGKTEVKNIKRLAGPIFISLISFFLVPGNGEAKIVYVNCNTLGQVHDGISWGSAFRAIQNGLNAASRWDEVWVASGTYVERITLKDDVQLYGGFVGNEVSRAQRDWRKNITVVDGDKKGTVVEAIGYITTLIDGFTIQNGKADDYSFGGGIRCYSSTITIQNNTIIDNIGNYGSGISLEHVHSFSVISHNRIIRNSEETSSSMGGGIFCLSSFPTIKDNFISENTSNNGGIYCDSSSAIISNNIITKNDSVGIFMKNDYWSEILNNIIINNKDYGLFVSSSSKTEVFNNTFDNNDSGIGILWGSLHSVCNNIITFNKDRGLYSYGSDVSLKNNCVYGNTSADYDGTLPGIGDISLDPLFVNQALGNYHLTISSPCINAGNDEVIKPDWLDIDGEARICGLHVDIGADEYQLISAIRLSRSSLNFGAVVAGAPTSSQTVIIGNSGSGTLTWTATSNRIWLGVMPLSGMGTGIIQISVNAAGQALGTQTGTVTISDPNATNNPQTINVTLTVKAAGTGTLPFGDFATPLDGTTGITGAIPVTGWVLDDIETTKVEIWRDPVAGEGSSIVFIGNGIFVEGARPDVETDYPEYPLNYRAGWGYMLLTNFLPNQGNGIFKIHAFATDKEGNAVLLGTKTITCDNAHAVKPFGTIDTPTQGGDASGNPFLNFGWVLTPLPKTVPKDGSTIDVYVDSVKVGNLATAPNVYNQYRSDVATAFPGLNNSGGPVGAFYLDTTKYANGVHTIYWIATDDAAAADGIGSRYFNVMNTGAGGQVEAEAQVMDMNFPLTFGQIAEFPVIFESLADLPVSFIPIMVKRGFAQDRSAVTMIPDNFGLTRIDIEEVMPLEIDLAGSLNENPDSLLAHPNRARYHGYQIVGTELRPLPIGSTLDPKTGTFSWMPGPGFLGTYDLVFIKEDGLGMTNRIPVKVTIRPKFKLKNLI